MDIEGFVEAHQDQWTRLARLAGRSRLTGAEADELVDLYQRTSTHLAVVRGSAYDPELEARLVALVTNARAAITGSGGSVLRSVAEFFGRHLPAAFYRMRWWALAISLLSLAAMVVVCLNVLAHPALLNQYFTDAQIDDYVNGAFESYYSENPHADFALQVWLHNAVVAANCLLLGVFVLPTLMILWTNCEQLGYVAALMINRDRADVFFGLLLPHGMLELTCIFFAAAAGLRLAWAWIAPGALPRARRLAEEGRAMGAVILGLALALGVSGLLEGFVTPSPASTAVRLGLGFLAWGGFLAYVLVLGRRATLAGHTGDVEGVHAESVDLIESAV